MDPRTARAEVSRRLGLSRWKREAELHRLLLKLFPTSRVQREASPSWLGRQRLDIFLPEKRLGVEYQGRQHYKAIEHFGGAEALARTRERDRRKRELCAANGVDLLEVKSSEPLTASSLRRRLQRWLD